MHNEYELLYLYQQEFIDNAKKLLFQMYQPTLKQIQKMVFYKYHYLPLECSDLDFISYLAFEEASLTFRAFYDKTFYQYLVQHQIWALHNYIKKFICKKHAILTNARDISDFPIGNGDCNNWIDYKNFCFAEKRAVIKKGVQHLTHIEKQVLRLKINGSSYQEIMAVTNLSYKQLDNLIQHIIFKFKKLWHGIKPT